jgi:hypothetical protein
MPAAAAFAERNGLRLDWDADNLRLRVTGLTQPGTNETFTLVGDFVGYRVIPPAWDLEDPDSGALGTQVAFPQPNGGPIGSIFHSKPVICAPFNRLAYADASGPHSGDWGASTGWLTAGAGYVRATTVGDMIATVHLHLGWTSGRMGPRARP